MRFRYLLNCLPLIISIFLLTNCNGQKSIDTVTQSNDEIYQVKQGSIYDGDTLRVFATDGEEIKLRFACVDAPEIKQKRGKDSRDHLRSLLRKEGMKVKLDITDTDRYGRKVAVLYLLNGKAVQTLQVKDGKVFGYDRYKSDCPIWNEIKKGETIAKNRKSGVWGDNPPQYPWEWRKKNR